MPEEKQTDDIEKVLSDLKSIEARKDDWHPSVNLCNLYVRLARDDCTGMDPLFSARLFPTFPQAGEHERGIIRHSDRPRLF